MILPDAKLLPYAYNTLDKQHTQARNWLKEMVNGAEPFALCWPVISRIRRISTDSRAFLQSFGMTEAVRIVTRWMKHPNIRILEPTDRHWLVFSEMLISGQVRAAMNTDAEIATYAVEHGAVLPTADRDFARFPGLETVNPLA